MSEPIVVKYPKLGAAIAFAALVAAAVVLEINGKPTSGLWVVIVIWAMFGF